MTGDIEDIPMINPYWHVLFMAPELASYGKLKRIIQSKAPNLICIRFVFDKKYVEVMLDCGVDGMGDNIHKLRMIINDL